MISEKDGPGSIYWDIGSSSSNGCHAIGVIRSGYLLDTPILENTTEMGDHAPGVPVTTGKLIATSSMDDLCNSDLILIWGGNPNFTHIPNAHFIYEARYRGAYIVTVAPDFSPSTIHADEWMNVNIGTDAALALSMAKVVIDEQLYKPDFLVEQTDMPFLVRLDNEEFLRETDMTPGGADDVFYMFDTASNKVVEAPRSSLALESLKPALEGEFDVETSAGTVKVTTVFERTRAQLKDYAPEQTESITGVAARNVRDLATRIAKARACSNIAQTNLGKFYHGMNSERSILLLFALTGHIGRSGAGYNSVPILSISGAEPFAMASGKYAPKIGIGLMTAKLAPEIIKMKLDGYSMEMIVTHFAREDFKRGNVIASALLYYQHGGLKELYGSARQWDPHLKRDFDEYLQEAVEKGWQFIPKTAPRIWFAVGGNTFRRARGYHKLIEHMLPKLDLAVTVDFRMSNTARYSDYVLPAAGYYERDDIAWGHGTAPYSHATTEAVKPVGNSKTDWSFHCLLVKKIQERAIARGITNFTDRHGEQRRLDEVYDDFTFQGRYTEDNPQDLLRDMLEMTENLDGITWDELKAAGHKRFSGVGTSPVHISNASDIEPGKPLVANSWHVQKKIPWPTLTRRMQFYIDHPFHKELGEILPVYKPEPLIGGDYPLQMTGGHNRWSIHAAQRDQKPLLRLQRGEPVMYVNTDDATERGVIDGDTIRVFNDLGDFEVHAMASPSLKPGQVVIYHAWEPFQFKNGKAPQMLTPSPLNPIQLTGGYFHLQPMVLMQSPGCTDRGTRVNFEKAQTATA
jgi:DMSO reductase family type II enzyme molybdopterin subunit